MDLIRSASIGFFIGCEVYDLPGIDSYELLIALLIRAPGLRQLRKTVKNKHQNKNISEENKKMINQTTYVTRRQTIGSSFARNRNTVRHTKRSLGSISQIVIVSMLTLVFGLIYVAEGTKATSFDYELSSVENDIAEMNAKKDDLAVERARLNSVASIESSAVASTMEDATVSGYAKE